METKSEIINLSISANAISQLPSSMTSIEENVKELTKQIKFWLEERSKLSSILKELFDCYASLRISKAASSSSNSINNLMVPFNLLQSEYDNALKIVEKLEKIRISKMDLFKEIILRAFLINLIKQDNNIQVLVRDIKEQIQQQQLLEIVITDESITLMKSLIMESTSASTLDPDEAITKLVCFSYPPYLNMSMINTFLSMYE